MLRVRVDDYPGTKPEEFWRHNIQNYALFHDQLSSRGIRYDLGVIPLHVQDSDLLWLAARPSIRVAIHGFAHDERFPNEFRPHQTHDEITSIILGVRKRFEQLLERPVESYIPPHNVIDIKTVRALLRAGITELHTGPGTDPIVAEYASKMGLLVLPSFPPFYGRSDELIACGHVPTIRMRRFVDDITVLGLHWTWEQNIGLSHLSNFLDLVYGET